MRRTLLSWPRGGLAVAGCCLCFVLASCAGSRPEPVVTQVRFTFEDATYRIRSIRHAPGGASYNELVGPNILAIDVDQDGLLDRVDMGGLRLADAQAIYDFGIAEIDRAGRLQRDAPAEAGFVYATPSFRTVIRSYRPTGEAPFNEFDVADWDGAGRTVLIDHEADGTLDERLRGPGPLPPMQRLYEAALQAGLRRDALVRSDARILVKR